MGIYTIRPAEQGDVDAIAKVASNSWKHTYYSIYPQDVIEQFVSRAYSARNLTGSIERDRQRQQKLFHVAMDARGAVVAFSHTIPVSNNEGSFELVRIYALPQTHGTGVGTTLLNQLFESLKDFSQLSAWVEKDNPIGRRFYERHGFQAVEEKDDEILGHKTQLMKYVVTPNLE